eukprot:gene10575-9293_t
MDDLEKAELILKDLRNEDPELPRTIPITNGRLTMGRVQGKNFADVVVSSKKFGDMVSRKHLTIVYRNPQ